MSLLLALLIGICMGAGTSFVFRRDSDYMLIDLILGVSGAVLGMVFNFFLQPVNELGFLSASGTVASILGAMILLAIYRLALRVPRRKHENIEQR